MKQGDLIKLQFGVDHFISFNVEGTNSIEISKTDVLIFIDNKTAFLNGDLYKFSSINCWFCCV